MKRVAVLVGSKSTSGERFVETLDRYSEDQYSIRHYSSIAIVIKHGVVSAYYLDDGVDVADTDLVYLRGITNEPLRHALAAYLKSKNIPVVNTESHTYQTITKLEQYVVMALAGVPVPDSVFITDPSRYYQVPVLLGAPFPYVAKSISGSNGNDNQLVASEEELRSLEIDQPVFQPFIPNEFDYRVIVAGDKVLLSYKRIRSVHTSDYKNNIGQGGRREMTSLPEELQHIAIKAAHAIGREFSGLDILTDSQTGESVVLEVNFNFGTPVFDDQHQEQVYYEAISSYFSELIR